MIQKTGKDGVMVMITGGGPNLVDSIELVHQERNNKGGFSKQDRNNKGAFSKLMCVGLLMPQCTSPHRRQDHDRSYYMPTQAESQVMSMHRQPRAGRRSPTAKKLDERDDPAHCTFPSSDDVCCSPYPVYDCGDARDIINAEDTIFATSTEIHKNNNHKGIVVERRRSMENYKNNDHEGIVIERRPSTSRRCIRREPVKIVI
eukprot:CAMPEP_0198137780 /NCGR_PEP_ID=MMETSP1443-20131203/1239_1 /TAXON_ID=186043 /ORGANISM="Entomoneis sp., Strain CCMP2396" /LENGTH=201 /DNA_ID=CAMNT_0043799325 /DNA_START=553 /DNA_END=1158 /DNA_ORIENTATION=-